MAAAHLGAVVLLVGKDLGGHVGPGATLRLEQLVRVSTDGRQTEVRDLRQGVVSTSFSTHLVTIQPKKSPGNQN